jgi:hypothetical protein
MCCSQAQLGASIASINKYLTRKTLPTDYFIRRQNMVKVNNLFDLFNWNQKGLLMKIHADLDSSKEFYWNDVLVYAALRWYATDQIWQFDSPDLYVKIKNNFKIISEKFSENSILKEKELLLNQIKKSKLKVTDLLTIQTDGTSLLYKMYSEGIIGLRICSTFADVLTGGQNEQHKKFHKLLLIVKAIVEKK